MSKSEKLASLLAIFALITSTRRENLIILDRVTYIIYLVQFQKEGKKVTKVLINSNREINVMSSAYAYQLFLQSWQTIIKA